LTKLGWLLWDHKCCLLGSMTCNEVLQSSEALMWGVLSRVVCSSLFTVHPNLHRVVLHGKFCKRHENAALGLSYLDSPLSAPSEVCMNANEWNPCWFYSAARRVIEPHVLRCSMSYKSSLEETRSSYEH
jgi:hypothetical protein